MMQKILNIFKSYPWAILSGALIGSTYIPFPPWAILFCYAPLWASLIKKNSSAKEAFVAGWLTQLTLTLIGFHWIAHTAHEFGGFPWILAVITLLLFSSLMHVYIPCAAAVAVLLRQKFKLSPLASVFVFALTLSLTERLWPSLFPWNLGYTLLWGRLPLFHWADTVGFLGLSTIVLLINALISWSLLTTGPKRWVAAGAGLLVFGVLNVTGAIHGEKWKSTDSQVRFLAIQANIGNMEKVYAEQGKAYQGHIIQKFLSESKKALQIFPESEILIWPETAIPAYMDNSQKENKYSKMMADGLKEIKKPLLSGAYSKDANIADPERSVFNALFLLDSEGRELSPAYRKTHLLAFGEYLPLSETFPILLKWLPFISNFGRGQGPEILSWPRTPEAPVHIGGQVCYEGLYPEFSRGLSLKGAHILANVTNDSWFGSTFEPEQHLTMTLARAIETRRPLIRSTNTGITTGILASGELLPQSPIHQLWSGELVISYLKNPPQTWYVLFGHWDWLLWVLVLAALLFMGHRHARSAKS